MSHQPTLYLMLGYPGAGKTTAAEVIAAQTGAVHLASDKIRLEMFPDPQFTEEEHRQLYQAIDNRTEELLKEGKSVIYDANLNRYIHRKEKYDICAQTGAKPVLVWIRTAEPIAKQRATEDGDGDLKRPYGNLAVSTFERLAREIEPPNHKEKPFMVEMDGTKISPEYVQQVLQL
jgi:predicted kinase